jgi:hypothetical protein
MANRQEGDTVTVPAMLKAVLDGVKNKDTLDISNHIGG